MQPRFVITLLKNTIVFVKQILQNVVHVSTCLGMVLLRSDTPDGLRSLLVSGDTA